MCVQKAVLESVQARQREHLDFEKPVYTAAAFYYAARQLKVRHMHSAVSSVVNQFAFLSLMGGHFC
jgi:hypothetical protein